MPNTIVRRVTDQILAGQIWDWEFEASELHTSRSISVALSVAAANFRGSVYRSDLADLTVRNDEKIPPTLPYFRRGRARGYHRHAA